jgi:hypothetical protein
LLFESVIELPHLKFDMATHKRQRGLWWKVGSLIFPLAFIWAYLFGLGWFDVFPTARDADRAAVEYRNSGMPWEAKDMMPPIADQDNAASELNAAMDEVDTKTLVATVSDVEKSTSANRWKEAEKSLQTVAPALELAAKAAEKSKLDFKKDWDLGPSLLFPEFQKTKCFVRLLARRARCEAAEHRPDDCVRDLTCAWRLSGLMGQTPILIGMFVEIACESIVINNAEQCAALWHGDAESLAKLQSFLAHADGEPDFVNSLRGEAYLGLAFLRNFDAYGGMLSIPALSGGPRKIDPSKLKRTGVPNGVWARSFATQHFRYWAAVKRMTDQLGNDPIATSKAMGVVAKQVSESPKASLLVESILLPVFDQAGDAVVKRDALLETAKALLASLIVEAKTGHLPTRIEDVPGSYVDPFTKGPLKMKITANSFRIYSVGPDLKDNGGLAESERGDSLEYDVVAAYPPIVTSTKRG